MVFNIVVQYLSCKCFELGPLAYSSTNCRNTPRKDCGLGVEVSSIAGGYESCVSTLMDNRIANIIFDSGGVLVLEMLIWHGHFVAIYSFGCGAGTGLVGFLVVVEREVVDDVGVTNGISESLVAGGRVD